ncbi:hypothetical protein MTO96_045409 [Rhipicephalus appendiculatus]
MFSYIPKTMDGEDRVQRTGAARIRTARVCYDSHASQSGGCPACVLFVTGLAREFHDHWLKVQSYRGVCASSARHPYYRAPGMRVAKPRKCKRPGPKYADT